jgi:iron complex outermembrane receptor protein
MVGRKGRKSVARVVHVLFCAPVVAFANHSIEDEDLYLVYGERNLSSIATGSPTLLRRAPSIVVVVTADEIAKTGATDLDEVLQTVAGVHVSRAPNTYSSLYQIRGISTGQNPQVLMLQNGIPMTTLFQGNKGTIWGGLPLENIARIEIIRGPGSALYGADALAGVINIITKTSGEIGGTKVGVRTGSFGTRNAWVQHGGNAGGMDIAAYLNVGTTNGHKRVVDEDAQTLRDRIAGTRASLAPGPVNVGYDSVDASLDLGHEHWRLRFGYKLRDDLGTGAGISAALDPVGKEKSERINTDLSWVNHKLAQDWGAGAAVSFMQYKQRIPVDLRLYPAGSVFPTGAFPDGMIGHPDTSERQFRVSSFATYSGLESHTLRVGVGYDDLDLYETRTIKNYVFDAAGTPVPAGPVADYSVIQPFMLPHSRQVTYLYAQDQWRLARDWELTLGTRYDHFSDFGGTTNPRVALVWDAALDVTAKLIYGRAFRAPSFSELYSINNPVQRGNPVLKPERVDTVEAAVTWQANDELTTKLSVFRYEMKDIIRPIPNAAPAMGTTFNNMGRQHGTGLEIEAEWQVSRHLQLIGNYSHQRSVDETTGRDPGFAPRNQAYLRASWAIAYGWQLNPQLTWVANRARSAGDPRPPVADYKTFDLTLRTARPVGRWEFAASVRNLFNADVREPSAPGTIPNDLPMVPRAFYLQASMQM